MSQPLQLLPDSKKFKILQLSNAVFCPSGYGVQSNGNLYEWNKYYDVRQVCNYGLQSRMLNLNGLSIYPPLPGDETGAKTAELIFRNSWSPDLFITLYDIWMGAYTKQTPQGLVPIHPHWIPIVMVDHEPIPEGTLQQASAAFHIVTPTLFGVQEFQRNGIEKVSYIPFGIDTKKFRPSIDPKADKNWLQNRSVPLDLEKQFPINENSFTIILNGANKDPYRKGFPRDFIALQLFLQNNPDAKRDTRMYVHSWMRQARDLPHTAKVLHVQEFIRGTPDYSNLQGVPDDAMAKIYGAGDVFMHLSEGGGFEIPILEALSCGLPVIGSDFLGMTELIKNNGWLIPAKTKYFTPLDALQQIDDEYKAAEALEDAYNHPEKRKKLGEDARKFALGFDWEKVNPVWIQLFENIRKSWYSPPVEQRRKL
jgi:glycosyltransferase involved in cell wall biosynthesis